MHSAVAVADWFSTGVLMLLPAMVILGGIKRIPRVALSPVVFRLPPAHFNHDRP